MKLQGIIAKASKDRINIEGFASHEEMADAILSAITASGYRILGPGELDAETLDRAELACFHQQSTIHDLKRTEWDRGNDSAVNGCIHAIRALKDKRDG